MIDFWSFFKYGLIWLEMMEKFCNELEWIMIKSNFMLELELESLKCLNSLKQLELERLNRWLLNFLENQLIEQLLVVEKSRSSLITVRLHLEDWKSLQE